MIYHPQLPPAVLLTWIQLRGLAWGGTVTPPLRMQELAALTGKSQATIYQHMSLLRHISALSWRSTGQGTIIVSFADQPSKKMDKVEIPPSIPDSQSLESQILESEILESTDPASLYPLPDSDSIGIPVMESENQASDQNPEVKVEGKGEREGEGEPEGERGFQNLPTSKPFNVQTSERSNVQTCKLANASTCEPDNVQTFKLADVQTLNPDPVSVYRSLAHLTPNPAQRRLLSSRVIDLTLWQQTVEHWLFHGWNPRNLAGMLELYTRGGPLGCHYCRRDHLPGSQAKSPLQDTLDSLESLQRKQDKSATRG